jgi:hypothetical protein
MFPYKVITDFNQAEEYRDNLDHEGELYLQKVDQFTATLKHDEPVNLTVFVKPSNIERFWLAFSYILLALGLECNMNEDYTTVVIYSMKH